MRRRLSVPATLVGTNAIHAVRTDEHKTVAAAAVVGEPRECFSFCSLSFLAVLFINLFACFSSESHPLSKLLLCDLQETLSII